MNPLTIPIWFIPSLVGGSRGSRVKSRWVGGGGGGGRVWSVVQSGRGVRWVRPGSHRGGVHGGAVEHRGREENRQLTLVVGVVDAARPAVRSHLPLHLHCGLPSRSLTTAGCGHPVADPTDRHRD